MEMEAEFQEEELEERLRTLKETEEAVREA
jgi:hypothetical protein